MKFQKRKDREAKYKILFWLRMKMRCAFIATECGSHSADCLGINEKRMIECEVKISMEDFKADSRKHKHDIYNHSNDYFTWQSQWIPNQFYYAVPTAMVEEVKAHLKSFEKSERKVFAKYGVIDFEKMQVEKRAGWLHQRDPNVHVKFVVALRMGSELIKFHEAWL